MIVMSYSQQGYEISGWWALQPINAALISDLPLIKSKISEGKIAFILKIVVISYYPFHLFPYIFVDSV